MERSAGILLSVSSLPSPYGIGTLGKAAYEFADFLAAAGQKYWQLLPLGVILAVMIIWAHRSNIGRLLRGEESKFVLKK